jgi:hypothetical protein
MPYIGSRQKEKEQKSTRMGFFIFINGPYGPPVWVFTLSPYGAGGIFQTSDLEP